MTQRICEVPDCGKPHVSQGMCPKHYQQARAAGTLVLTDKAAWHRITDFDPEAITGTCTTCGPVDVKLLKKSGTSSRYPACGVKVRERRAARREREKHTEEYLAYHRQYNRRNKYGLPPGGVEERVAAANHQCEICRCTLTLRTARLDHDHSCCDDKYRTCGECLRGVLCNACNSGLGLFADDPTRLQAAIEYLARHSAVGSTA